MTAHIEQYIGALAGLCQQNKVNRLDLFGSAATGAFNYDTSDLDFIATFEDADKPGDARRYFDFAEALKQLFKRPVDLLTERSISNPCFIESVNPSRITLYEDRRTKVVA